MRIMPNFSPVGPDLMTIRAQLRTRRTLSAVTAIFSGIAVQFARVSAALAPVPSNFPGPGPDLTPVRA
jgi:hypothetical protein